MNNELWKRGNGEISTLQFSITTDFKFGIFNVQCKLNYELFFLSQYQLPFF